MTGVKPVDAAPVEIRVQRAAGLWGRARGLLGRPAPAPGEALWITPCRQVHTLGMAYAIDVVHLDADARVLSVQTLRPWRLGRFVWRAAGVLETRAGEAQRLQMVPGARVRLIEIDPHATTRRPSEQ